MWMVGGYNMNETSHHQHRHHHHQVNLDGLNGSRKLRPLIPRPPAVASASSAATHSCNFGLYTGSHIFGAAGTVGGEQGFSHKSVNNINNNKEEVNNNNNGGGGQQGVMSSSSSSRWNPTAEQLRTLEDLYRRGTRTPSTDQIQRITAQLRRYGKIEGKNVFYWFQNHKARERQKRRRELQLLSSSSSNHPQSHHDDDDEPIIPRKERGPASAKQCYETEQTRSYYASAAAEECGVMSMQRAIAAEKAGRRAEAVSVHLSSSSRHNNNINNNNNSGACLFQPDNERNATWHNLAPSSSSPSFCYSPSSLIARVIATTSTPPTTADACATPETRRFIGSLKESNPNTTNGGELYIYEDDDEGGDSTTLQLFPLRSRVDGQQQQQHDQDKSKERDVHFFEFLPPKID